MVLEVPVLLVAGISKVPFKTGIDVLLLMRCWYFK